MSISVDGILLSKSGLVRESTNPISYEAFRVALDVAVAAVLLVIAAPVMLLTAVLIKLTSRGPVFYSQTRMGLNGKLYAIYKLRTMRHNCEKESGARWSTKGDNRITPIGKFLRLSHLDELPQLWNVLKGDMSLVGPRPERPEFLPTLEAALPDYCERLRVRPGVTGLAQVQLPPDSDIDSVRRKLAHDLYYVDHAGLLLDLKILIATAFHVVKFPVRPMRAVLNLPGGDAVEVGYESRNSVADTVETPVLTRGRIGLVACG